MRRFLLILHTVGASAAAAILAGPATAAPPGGCGVNLAAPEVIAAINSLPPYPGTDWNWSSSPTTLEGNFNPCATLSTALVTVEGATASSPITALMFNHGTYLGTATSKAYGFTRLNAARTSDDTVALDYATPGVCDACAPAAVTIVRYQWQNNHVVMLDPPPPS